MYFDRIGKSSDFESRCGKYRIRAANDNFNGAYWPIKVVQASPYKGRILSTDYMSFEDCRELIESLDT